MVLRDVRVHNNANTGLSVNTAGATGTGAVGIVVEQSSFSSNATGISLVSPAGTIPAAMMLINGTVANNSGTGLATDGAGALMRVGFSTITGNGLGVSAANGSTLATYSNNRNLGNPRSGGMANNGAFTGPVASQ